MISAVLLAAGKSTRMGSFKPLMKLRGRTLIERAIRSLQKSKVDEVIVVLGFKARDISEEVRKHNQRKLRIVVNPEYAAGMSTSLKAGLRAVNPRAEAAVFTLVDLPLVGASVINRVVDGYRRSKAPIVLPVFKGKRGHPVLMARRLFPAVMKIRGDIGARAVVKAHRDEVYEVPVDMEGILLDLDTPKEFEAVEGKLGVKKCLGRAEHRSR